MTDLILKQSWVHYPRSIFRFFHSRGSVSFIWMLFVDKRKYLLEEEILNSETQGFIYPTAKLIKETGLVRRRVEEVIEYLVERGFLKKERTKTIPPQNLYFIQDDAFEKAFTEFLEKEEQERFLKK